MNKLQCKICGGKLVMNESGIAVCDYCGMEYRPEALQKMLVELSGPIEVQGINSKQRLIEKGEALERLGKTDDAINVYTELVKEYPDEYIGFYKLCKIELERTNNISPSSSSWNNPFAFSADQIKVLKVLNPEKAAEMEQLYKQKLNQLIEYDHEFDCYSHQSNLYMIINMFLKYSYNIDDPRICSWNEEKSTRINSIFHDMISGFSDTNGKGNIEWAYGNRAIVSWEGRIYSKKGEFSLSNYTHCFHIILDCRFENDEDTFLRELAAHKYSATTSYEDYDLIPPFTWAGWKEKKLQREKQIQEEKRKWEEEERKKKEERRKWRMSRGLCTYCGGSFETKRVNLFLTKEFCRSCHKQKDY